LFAAVVASSERDELGDFSTRAAIGMGMERFTLFSHGESTSYSSATAVVAAQQI